MLLAHSPLHHRRLRPFIPTVLDRPCPRLGWAQRIHIHELVTHKRTIHSKTHEQTRYDGLILHRADRRVPDRTFYLRTWTPTLVGVVPVPCEGHHGSKIKGQASLGG